jgi:cystathionine beta-lyase
VSFDFDRIIHRRGTGSAKWDALGDRFGRVDAIPLWVADMDFQSPPAVLRTVSERVAHGVFGYAHVPDAFYEAVTGWLARRHEWKVDPEWILPGSGVVFGLATSVRAFTEPGDGVVIQPPVYHPFRRVIEANGRRVVENPLWLQDGRYVPDLEQLESCLRDGAQLLMLCSPHNPGGRAWTSEELHGMLEIADRYDVVVVSDEIHFDLLLPGTNHIPTARISGKDRIVTLTAPTKTFNFPALRASYAVIEDSDLRTRYEQEIRRAAASGMSLLGAVATAAAYNEGAAWLNDLLHYLEGNLRMLREHVSDLDGIRLISPEATYLAWLDCRGLALDDKALMDFFVRKAGLALSSGVQFGRQGSGFMRLNFACPRSVLAKALEQLRQALRA